jgi:hypothetical protein
VSGARFVSEPIRPTSAPISAAALAAGTPSLPEGFTWRKTEHRIAEVLDESKITARESFSNEKYVRRHQFRVRMEDGAVWTVYFLRQPGRSSGGRKAPRWFLLSVEGPEAEGAES